MIEQRSPLYSSLEVALKPLKAFFEDPQVVEIMCNGDDRVWVEAAGSMSQASATLDQNAINRTIISLANSQGAQAVAGSHTGVVDAEIPLDVFVPSAKGSGANMRMAAVMAPTSLRGHALCIRKHSPVVHELSYYNQTGSFSKVCKAKPGSAKTFPFSFDDIAAGGDAVDGFLRWMILNKKTVLVSGATGSGKTTLFKALIREIPACERLLVIEDTPELVVSSPNYVSFQSNRQKGVTPQLLVKAAMRMRPDRILLGELRDETAMNFLEAANTGHPGSIATLHANDAASALARLEFLSLMFYRDGSPPIASIRHRILSTVDFVIQVGKDGRPGVVEEIAQVVPDTAETNGYAGSIKKLFSRYQ